MFCTKLKCYFWSKFGSNGKFCHWHGLLKRCEQECKSLEDHVHDKISWFDSICVLLLRRQTQFCMSEYIKHHNIIFELWRKIWGQDWSSQLYTQLWSSCEIKAWKKSGLNRIQTHDLCNIGAMHWYCRVHRFESHSGQNFSGFIPLIAENTCFRQVGGFQAGYGPN